MDLIVSRQKASLDAVVAALHIARSQIFNCQESASFEPCDTSELSSALQNAALTADEQTWRNKPALAATYFCLASSLHLLEVCRALIEHSRIYTTAEEIDRCKELMFEIKDAGREAYRAALTLCGLPHFDKKSLLTIATSDSLLQGEQMMGNTT